MGSDVPARQVREAVVTEDGRELGEVLAQRVHEAPEVHPGVDVHALGGCERRGRRNGLPEERVGDRRGAPLAGGRAPEGAPPPTPRGRRDPTTPPPPRPPPRPP